MSDPASSTHCRFITSLGGAAYCQDPPYLLGFCIADLLDDQDRRRAINFHGVELPEDVKPVS
jgi:hypothetical protein